MKDTLRYVRERLQQPHHATFLAMLICLFVIPFVMFVLLVYSEAQFQSTADSFHTLKRGLCTLLVTSNKAEVQNKKLLHGQARRARIRAKVDTANGNMTAAQSDRDAAKLYTHVANQSKPIDLSKFGC